MHNLNLDQIKEKILSNTKLSKEELEAKIKQKLDALSGLISPEGAAHIIANEYKVQLFDPKAALKIGTLQPGLRNLEISGQVQRVYETRTFSRDGKEGKVANFLISDDSGMIRIVAWNSRADDIKDLKEKDIIRIRNGYVRENRDRIEIHINDSAEIAINPEGVEVKNAKEVGQSNQQALKYNRKKIAQLEGNESAIEILGTVVQLYDPKFFEICKQCNKRLKQEEDKWVCPEHGIVEPEYRSVLNIFIDDGSDNIQCVLWQDQIKQILEVTEEQLNDIRQNPEKYEEHKNKLLGSIITIKGNSKLNTMFNRMEFNVRDIDLKPDPQKEIDNLGNELQKARDEVVKKADTKKGFETAKELTEDEKAEEIKKLNEELAKKSENEEMLDVDDVEDI